MKDYRKFEYTNENYLIFRTIETFSRTASGKSWKSRPDEVENEIVPPKYYENYVTAIPFFNNFTVQRNEKSSLFLVFQERNIVVKCRIPGKIHCRKCKTFSS